MIWNVFFSVKSYGFRNWPEHTHCYLARNWADWWRIKTYFSREKTQILKNHFGHPISKFRQWIEVLQQLFMVFTLSLLLNRVWLILYWQISINVPVSLLLLVTCLFFLRVEYNDFNFSSEWGLAGLDQNQPRPDISKNEKNHWKAPFELKFIELKSESIHFWPFHSSLIVQRGASSQ